MSYSGGMSQLAHDQEEEQNESGLDLCSAWHYQQEQNSALAGTAQSDNCKPTSRIDEQPF